jgi:hypothetical protein
MPRIETDVSEVVAIGLVYGTFHSLEDHGILGNGTWQ